MLPTIPQRQGVKTRQIFYPEDAGAMGTDPAVPKGYVMPLADEGSFGTDQGLIQAPVYKGTRRPFGVVSGNVTAEGEDPYGLEFRTFPRVLKELVGPDGYVRPGGGTTSLHRFYVPTDPDAEMGSCQLQNESLETPKQILRNRGVRPGTISLAYANEGVARYGVAWMGTGDEVRTDLAGTVTDEGYKAVSFFNGFAKLNGYFLVGMTDFSITIDPGLSRSDAAFREGIAAGINYNVINVAGRLALMFSTNGAAPENNMNFYDLAVNQTPVPLDIAWSDAPASQATAWCRIILPATRFSRRGFRPGGSAGKIITQDYQVVDDISGDLAAEKFGTIRGTYNLTGTNNVFGVKIDGGATLSVTLPTGAAVTTDAIVTALMANGPFAAAATASNFMGRVMVTSKTKGASSSVQYDTAVANSAHTALGFDNVAFTGFTDIPFLIEVYNDITVDL
jgi:hypothetical protein